MTRNAGHAGRAARAARAHEPLDRNLEIAPYPWVHSNEERQAPAMMVEALIIGVFGTLGVDLVEIPFTLESARSSFLKTIQKVPPSDTTQEFKDGVLWADCVGLLSSDDVTLVTNDLAFYAGRNLDKGLAPELKAEVENQPHVLHVIPKITDRYPTNAFHTA